MFKIIRNLREIRQQRGHSQKAFWEAVGVTQSGGSRYESGRAMPKAVRELLRLVHIEQIDLAKIKREDFEIVECLKETHPDLHKSLKRAVRERNQAQAQEAA